MESHWISQFTLKRACVSKAQLSLFDSKNWDVFNHQAG
ncbi:hypothetical protein Nizo2259_2429 [Lactiplantibacillus plantarum]|uniref:Uncharacterized protein n=1 Tax=Lactiplantibacillus plantarum TaxID=1590 RepID=A0A166EI86_LACPN|nr:hypothetical protein AWV72_00482 [Lactiplantibacillus plantarum]KZT79647.1 hypothetical protein Nizo1838_1802 [Lactiplantibacillus plantarum]KZT86999.1 hypothetical protein Nizo2256_2489 [Lactiplantibacillus plantarum]KZT90134.1 hypothetical protein Nizo2029_0503 [Lactiplantibacillus plantarum]KZT94889.1 hypothetical protein Nizo2259_2429 [Lactiplantibacillus plantarum]